MNQELLIKKVRDKRRLNQAEGEALYELDLYTLGELADNIRREKYANKSYFNINRHINPTNICKDICKFCAYSATRKNPNQYAMSHEEILSIVDNSVANGAKEMHIVSAHNPEVGLEWYMGIFSKIKQKYPQLHVKALTAAEVDFLAREYDLSYDEVLDMMIESGVDSMPGGGAEIFDEEVRDFICKGKVTSAQWLEIHKKWHQRGRMSNVTMLFGHVEERRHRIDHMLRLRDLQDETGGFNAFIPLVYQRENNYLKVTDYPTGQEILKTYAISRILLDNIPHIKAYWVTASIGLALIAQEFGADDLDGTIEKESIQSAAGASSSHGMNLHEFVGLIKNSGFVPIERDSLYNELKEY
ncbi:Gene SCO4494, often clustered with other genes in menaquinone via futalosine pathway [hydrothermal vent metagenome]|uniref:Gene SCO4494, often clustered with other genes in menaquinone via futalosine pathway n=1 Tax=hydrothermal vent metagenome TaxID=652676 RepID=A0A1W1C7V1_9ZZZZ